MSAADELRTARRASLHNLLDRLQRTGLTETERALLRQHVEAEIHDAATGPRILCAHTRPGSHTTVCDLPAGHGDHDGATGYGERVTWPAATEATQPDTRWQPDETLDYGQLPPPATSPNAQLHTGTSLEQPERTTANNPTEQPAGPNGLPS